MTNKWEDLTNFFDFPAEIRKYTKNKMSFSTGAVLKKSAFLTKKT